MKEFIVDAQSDGKRADRWLSQTAPSLSAGMIQKYIRLGRVKQNNKAVKKDTRLSKGDLMQVYLGDECFEKPKASHPMLENFKYRLQIVYEDDNLLLVHKPAGLVCHPDDQEKVNTLIQHARAYLYQKGAWDGEEKSPFAPALCNRIDRFTGGLVMIAKNQTALKRLDLAVRNREISKRYLCIVHGRLNHSEGVLDHYLLKEEGKKKVQVLKKPHPAAQRAMTGYRVLEERGGLSLVSCELFTGRTHQIRAQFAFIGHPLLGDGQYGNAKQDKAYGRTFQALYANELTFLFQADPGPLGNLQNQTFSIPVPFAQEFAQGREEDGREKTERQHAPGGLTNRNRQHNIVHGKATNRKGV